VERVAPAAALAVLDGTRIAVTTATVGIDGKERHGLETHRSAGWLVANGFDAAREGVVEVSNADDYLTWRAERKHAADPTPGVTTLACDVGS
jgi:hypothetical protein